MFGHCFWISFFSSVIYILTIYIFPSYNQLIIGFTMCLHLQSQISVYLHVANFKLLIMIKIVTNNTFTPKVVDLAENINIILFFSEPIHQWRELSRCLMEKKLYSWRKPFIVHLTLLFFISCIFFLNKC